MESLIAVKQLPVSASKFQAIQTKAGQRIGEAKSLICTPESLLAVKSTRAEVQKEYDALEEWRKAIKNWVMEEYKRFEAQYKVSASGYVEALELYSSEIRETENAIKKDCEDSLRTYFDELCVAHGLDWLTYERAGIKVDMASAKAKMPKKLREQLAAFVVGVSESVGRINLLDDADEIIVEFQRSLDAADAICTVQDRHRRIEKQKSAQEARKAVQDQETDRVRRVEALAPPVVTEVAAKEETLEVSFTMHPTISQYEEKIKPIMKELKKICVEEDIQYE